MKSEEFTQLVNTFCDEVKQRLLDGNFQIVGCVTWGFSDRYELNLSGARLFLCVDTGGWIRLDDTVFSNVSLSTDEREKIYKHLMNGGIKTVLDCKIDQRDKLDKEISNLEKTLKGAE